MMRMREAVAVNNVYQWAANFILALSTIGASKTSGNRNSEERLVETDVA